MREYIVKPLFKEEEIQWDFETLPKPPFRILTVGPSNTSKSTTTSYMFASDETPYKKYFG